MHEGANARGNARSTLKGLVAIDRLSPKEATRWPDWYAIPDAWLEFLVEVPQIQQLRDGTSIVHRSHLPLLARARGVPLEELLPQSVAARGVGDWWTPRPWQAEGVQFIHARRGALIADEMRLGKTPQVVAAHDPKDGPLVVVGPLMTRHVWTAWMRRRWPNVPVGVVEGRTFERSVLDTRLVFAHYDVLPAWQAMDFRPGTLVFDEPHLLSNHRSLRSQAALILATRAVRVVATTGTPLWNSPAGLYTQLACLAPGAWGKWHDFAVRYAGGRRGAHGFVTGAPTHVEEFRLRLGEIMLRRTWRDVRADLPETVRRTEIAPISALASAQIDLEAEAARKESAERSPIGALARLRQALGGQKLEPAIEEAVRLVKLDYPVVVWTWHRDMARILADGIARRVRQRAFVLTGDDSAPNRERTMDAWRGTRAGVLVATIAVGQVGIDLAHAQHAIFAELDFTPATIGQAEMRTFSPDRQMIVTYIAADHPVDRQIVAALERKFAAAAELGVPAADAAIDSLGDVFGVRAAPDLARLRQAVTARGAA